MSPVHESGAPEIGGILVQKFGGTSVATLEHIARVARRSIEAHDAGFGVVVVVSAMSGETDRLLSLARQASILPDPRELDVLASTGEQVTAALTAMSIASAGRKSRSLLGHQVRIVTDSTHTDARIRIIDSSRIKSALAAGEIVVLAGFQGINDDNDITTLGRGGSDTTAVAVAAALDAQICEIYTDVDGVYTADPAVCPAAQRLARISYRQMLAFSSHGAKVLHTRSVALAMKYRIPIHVRTSFSAIPGTWVTDDGIGNEAPITGIAQDKNIAYVEVLDRGSRMSCNALIELLSRSKISMEFVNQGMCDSITGERATAFIIKQSDLDRTVAVVEEWLSSESGGNFEIAVHDDVAKVSVIGIEIPVSPTHVARLLQLLRTKDIAIKAFLTNATSISCLVHREDSATTTCIFHEAFDLQQRI